MCVSVVAGTRVIIKSRIMRIPEISSLEELFSTVCCETESSFESSDGILAKCSKVPSSENDELVCDVDTIVNVFPVDIFVSRSHQRAWNHRPQNNLAH